MAAPLIALYSPVMQSGKTTVADTLVLSRGFTRVKFADPFKGWIEDLLAQGGAPPEAAARMIEDPVLKERSIPNLGVSVRQLTQSLGTWGRNINPDLWVKVAMEKALRSLRLGIPVVIDDMRFPNEYEAVIRAGGHPVRVFRPGMPPYTAHPSEGLLESYPMTLLHNGGSLRELRETAETLPEALMG